MARKTKRLGRYDTGLEGLDSIMTRMEFLRNFPDESEVEDVLHSVAKRGRERARSRIKSVTGNLRRSIVAKKFQKKIPGNPAVYMAIDYRIAPHAHLVEFGHGGPNPAPPHPFWRPAVDETQEDFKITAAARLKPLIQGILKWR